MVEVPEPFHPVVNLPEEYWVFDFTRGQDKSWECPFEFQIGRYNEYRPGMYETEIFGGVRNIHVGIDIGAPVDTPVYAFGEGKIHSFGMNSEAGSYGPTIITEHDIDLIKSSKIQINDTSGKFWVLHGHLSKQSLNGLEIGMEIDAGYMIARIGDEHENGGWPPHLHFQLSLEEPETFDLPGVVAKEDIDSALTKYPDPRIILGDIY
ncbi:MAG: peptidase M23 [Euryarchaeota archaeon TMED248]|nr:MAG: peptidase M23 [Euryarchaeota archaeon TMED248]